MTGMLWFDNTKLDLLEKLRRAAEYYQRKYSQPAQVVLVSTKTLSLAGPADYSSLPFLVKSYPLPLNHFCAGRDDGEEYLRLTHEPK